MLPALLVARWSSLVARRAHNPKVPGSNPGRATMLKPKSLAGFGLFAFCLDFDFYGAGPEGAARRPLEVVEG